MQVKVKLNMKGINLTKGQMRQALVETADAVKSDVMQSGTMPFGNDTTAEAKKRKYLAGTLQDRSTFVDDSKKKQGKVSIVSDTPYARRLYFHPEYNFYKGHNKDAGGLWFAPYIDGNKKNFVKKTFINIARSKMR